MRKTQRRRLSSSVFSLFLSSCTIFGRIHEAVERAFRTDIIRHLHRIEEFNQVCVHDVRRHVGAVDNLQRAVSAKYPKSATKEGSMDDVPKHSCCRSRFDAAIAGIIVAWESSSSSTHSTFVTTALRTACLLSLYRVARAALPIQLLFSFFIRARVFSAELFLALPSSTSASTRL